MKIISRQLFNLLAILLIALTVNAQKMDDKTFSGLEFRNIGPAMTSGRIADIAIHPENENVWYVAVGSGGVWKTMNSGTTWKPIFDSQSTYSIGCLTIDPNNPHTIWVGTGENVGGRHVAFGEGIFVSHDDGKSWKNMGLKDSEHLSNIIVHPGNPDVIWVASQGPLWSKGGQRGIYKSTDGGKSWVRTLGDNEWVGATDIVIDPMNPDVLYAATWQRQRTVAAYLGGGPGSGIHKSVDGGETWTELTNGIPKSNLGKIGLAISPFNNDIIYAAIELDRTEGGLYMSTNRGASWNKQSDMVSGGTGPHYYQELYASPHQEGRLYLMNNYVLISDDHGKTYQRMNERNKHVDSHAMAFKSSDPNYVLFGTDGGLYESFDLTKSWKYFRNLPITQYYKVAVDDAVPFYHVYGGTQDNGSHGGPSQTMSSSGIRNDDWWKTLGADGHQSATEPGNPDITYGEFQQGVLWRVDQTTRETVFIQPQPGEGDPYERYN
ncbi:MAG: glycosyl hydrolase, partial [Flavobacteriaceae bacterium]|nr:glycosyl hydrolase [Flavobacteriaceae bacterium]